MAKKSGATKMHGPLYTGPGQNLGPEQVSGPTGSKNIPDPLGFNKTRGGK